MLTLHTSHKTEYLLEHLAQVIKSQAKAGILSPFDRDVFLIQSQGMERWLSQGLADRFGVWANSEFLFPGKFFNAMAQRINQSLKTEIFAREQMIWRIEALLRQLSGDIFTPLSNYLQTDDMPEVKRFQLATQIAQAFDQYQIMRPDMLNAWMHDQLVTQEAAEIWQRAIWKQLLAALPDQQHTQHRGQMWLSVIDHMNRAEVGELSHHLPKRISMFGISSMPPIFLHFLQGLARHTQVDLYVMQPCRHYWGDIAGIKASKIAGFSRVSLTAHEPESLSIEADIQHPLLSLLGQQGREFHQLFIEQGNADWSFDSFDDFSGDIATSLTRLQDGILDNRFELIKADNSIQVVSCHSAMREVQVLKDYLLSCLDADPSLELRDILVMAPDIANYEPYIAAVFDDHRFRYTIADRSLRSSNDILDALIELLIVISGRFEWSRVLDLLEKPVIYQKFGLTEVDLAWIRAWIEQSQIRWGKDETHKQTLGLPPLPHNTWSAGLAQLMQGYAQRGTGIEIEGSVASALGILDHFVRNILFQFSEKLQEAQSLDAWHNTLMALLDQVFTDNAYQHLAQLRSLIDQLLHLPSQADYSLAVLLQWLETSVGEHKTSQGFLAGQLTFCSMLPMRSIPFSVIAILGLNEGFPKIDRRPSFDLMGGSKGFRKGDRSSRRDDRYQFLDAILCARNALYLSYVGQSIHANRDIPPSVVLSELLSCFEQGEQMIVKHPMQAFSPRYFTTQDHDAVLSSYDTQAAKAAVAFLHQEKTAHPWWEQQCRLPDTRITHLALPDLIRFFRDPQQHFVQQIVGVRFDDLTTEVDIAERFVIEGLERYHVNQAILAACLSRNLDHFKQQMITRGAWMQGTFGELTLEEQIAQVSPLSEQVMNLLPSLGEAVSSRFISQSIAGITLEGWLAYEYEQGNLLYRAARLKPKDHIQAWIYHLLGEKSTYLFGLGDKKEVVSYRFTEMTTNEREQHLGNLIQHYLACQVKPSAMWVEAAWEYVQPKKKTGKQKADDIINESEQRAKAEAEMQAIMHSPYLSEYAKLITHGQEITSLLTEDFYQTANLLIKPIYDHQKKSM